MSYGELMWLRGKLNSGGEVPLNHLLWLDAYKTYGQESYVYSDPAIWNELCNSKVAANDPLFNAVAFDYLTSNGGDIAKFLSGISGPEAGVFHGLDTVEKVLKSEAALSALINTRCGFALISNSTSIQKTFRTDKESLRILIENQVYQAYFEQIPAETTTQQCTELVYLVKMETRGVQSVYSSYSTTIHGGCSGAAYTECGEQEVLLRNAAFSDGQSYSDQAYTINKYTTAFRPIPGSYGNWPYQGTLSHVTLNTVATYKPLFR